MKIYTYRPPANAESPRAALPPLPPLAPGTSWVRFGRETVLYSDDSPGGEVVHRASRGARLAPRLAEATREQLHVVVQNGRLFQQLHPDVPVLHDRGRFLLVQLDSERARRLQVEHETCYGLMPLAENQVVFEARGARAAGAPVPFIRSLTDQLTRATVEANLTKLVSFGTRHSTSAGYSGAVTWAQQQFDAMGYDTKLQDVAVGAGVSRNVIADKAGSGANPRRVVLVTAHLDSINLRGGPSAPAPGADDNGSGSAGLLEIARVLQGHRGVSDLRLILFGGEEEGLFGSKQHVAALAAPERSRIDAVVNMDMIGSLNAASPSVLLEGAPVSQSVIDGLSDAAATYTQLTVETSLNPFASDHVPFIDAGVPAVLTIEGADSANDTVHSEADALGKIDYDLLLEILRMNVAFVAGAIGLDS
jgi:Peptidase family M28